MRLRLLLRCEWHPDASGNKKHAAKATRTTELGDYQLIRLRISFICSRRRGRTVALNKKCIADINVTTPVQMSWWHSRDTKISTSCRTRHPLLRTRAHAVSIGQTCTRDKFDTRKYGSGHARIQPRNCARQRSNQTCSAATIRGLPAAHKEPALSPPSFDRTSAAGPGGPAFFERRECQLRVLEDRLVPGRLGRRRCPARGSSGP